jgi:hypothetical protein
MACMGEQTVRRYAPLLVAALVLVAVGGTWAVLRGGGSTTGAGAGGAGSDEPLRLVGWAPAGAGQADPRYALADGADLPDGPGSAAVHRVRPRDDVADLRSALAELAPSLVVQPDGQWSTGPMVACGVAVPPGTTVSSDGGGATDQPCSRTEGMNGGPTEVAPLPARQAVLAALGLTGEQSHVITRAAQPDGSELYALDPVVSGLPTSGLRTTLVGAADGSAVSSGAGWLVRTPQLSDYPVVPAADAYQLLRRTPLPMPLIACPEPLPEGTDPVPCGGPIRVTGARLGLSLQQSPSGYLLLPAWFFTFAGSGNPIVQLAVEPSLLQPAPAGGGTSGGSSGSSGSSGSGGAVPPATASAAPPGPGEPVPDPQSRFTAVTRGDGDRTLDVTFWGGVEACYAYDVRAEEDARRVRIWLVERTPHSDKACIDLAQERHATVTLQQPLGLRTVEDGDSGTVLLGPAK